jgi:hypothetical protein
LFAGGANGGVFRKKLNNLADPSDDGAWEPISDGILSLSTGDLESTTARSGTRPAMWPAGSGSAATLARPGALPLTTVFDITVGPDGYLYAATHGRGIWKTPVNSL